MILGMDYEVFIGVFMIALPLLIAVILLPIGIKKSYESKAKKEAAKGSLPEKPMTDTKTHTGLASAPSVTTCPDCGGMVSKNAEACPHCGHVFKKPAQSSGASGFAIFIAIVLAVIFLIWFLPQIFTVKFTITPVVGK